MNEFSNDLALCCWNLKTFLSIRLFLYILKVCQLWINCLRNNRVMRKVTKFISVKLPIIKIIHSSQFMKFVKNYNQLATNQFRSDLPAWNHKNGSVVRWYLRSLNYELSTFFKKLTKVTGVIIMKTYMYNMNYTDF